MKVLPVESKGNVDTGSIRLLVCRGDGGLMYVECGSEEVECFLRWDTDMISILHYSPACS